MKILSFFLIIHISISSNHKNLKNSKPLKTLPNPRSLEGETTQTIAETSINQSPLSGYQLTFSSNMPPPPPTYAQGTMAVHKSNQTINYPAHHSQAWQMNNYPQIYNPYYGHLWAQHPLHQSAYGYMPFGLHPFMFPSMGAYGLNPLGAMNPMFGSINPFMNSHSAAMGLAQQGGQAMMGAGGQGGQVMDNRKLKKDFGQNMQSMPNMQLQNMQMQNMQNMPNMQNLPNIPNMQNMQNMPNMQNMQNMPNMQNMQNMPNMQNMQLQNMQMQNMQNMQYMQIQNMQNRQGLQNSENMQGGNIGMDLRNDVQKQNGGNSQNSGGPNLPPGMNMQSISDLSKKII